MSKGFQALCTLCALGALGADGAYAQTEVRSHIGTVSGDVFGTSVASAGDVNGDGVNDYMVGAIEDGNIFMEREGFVKVYSGADGSLIRTHDGESNFQLFGASVAGVGDTNPGTDTADDYAVGANFHSSSMLSSRGKVFLFSGANGSLRWSVEGDDGGDELGTSVGGGGDVNGDGVDDVIAGAPRSSANGSSSGYGVVLSGVDGSEIHRIDGGLTNERRGASVCIAGNLNPGTDSNADFVIGSQAGGVGVYSGATGGVLYTLSGLSPNDVYGFSVASMGDVTGDGIPEIIVGAPQGNFLFLGPGYVEVRNGANGALVFRETGANAGDNYGRQVANAGDWNADGFDDVLVAVVPSSGSAVSVQVLSGLDGALLDTLSNGAANDREGSSVAGVGDTDGDGRVEILLGAPLASDSVFQGGRAVVYESPDAIPTGCTGGSAIFCTSLPNSTGDTATLALAGSTNVSDNNVVLVSTDLPTNQPGVFYYGNGMLDVPFGNGTRCVGGTSILRFGAVSTGPAGVAATAVDLSPVHAPAMTINGDSTWYFQFWFRDPDALGVNFSDGLRIDFCD